jgi:hypothetical protein
MGLRDHQVSLNINICKGRSLAKAHHREDLLQVLWVVRLRILGVTNLVISKIFITLIRNARY